jgi:nucleoside-diphosphate-sugar epimerase
MSEILVTGGNGFVGRHLIQALQERGDTVRALVLPGEDARWLEDRGVAVHRGDICLPESLVTPMRGTGQVLHLAGLMGVPRPLADYRAVNVTGTRNVCGAALAAGVSRFVHMSSAVVYAMGMRCSADESFPLAPFPHPYPVTKAAGDMLVQRMIRDHKLPAVIVRPDQIFGPGDEMHFGRVADRLAAGKGVIIGRGDNWYPLVYLADIIQGLLLALDHADAVGQTYNITSDQPLTQQQFLEAIAHEIGARPPRIHVPYRALYAAGCLGECLAALTRSKLRAPTTRFGVAFSGLNSRRAADKARRELGYTPRVDLRAGVQLTAAWYRDKSQPYSEYAAGHIPAGAKS